MIEARESVETRGWTDRELLLRTYYQTVETNGSVRQLQMDVYGNPALEVVGLKQIAVENMAYREKLRISLRVAGAVLATAMSILTAILILVVEHVL